VNNWNDFREFLLDVNVALLGSALFYWSKPMARALNSWTVRCYERFPKLKRLPGSQNAGTELNDKATSVCFRICGALFFSIAMISITFSLLLLNK
jgi:hypothetical protein